MLFINIEIKFKITKNDDEVHNEKNTFIVKKMPQLSLGHSYIF